MGRSVVSLLLVGGLFLSLYAVYVEQAFAAAGDGKYTALCDFSPTMSCSTVRSVALLKADLCDQGPRQRQD